MPLRKIISRNLRNCYYNFVVLRLFNILNIRIVLLYYLKNILKFKTVPKNILSNKDIIQENMKKKKKKKNSEGGLYSNFHSRILLKKKTKQRYF